MLVAFTIMAFSLAMIYRVNGGTARNAGELEHYQHAALLAESVLNLRDTVPASGWSGQGDSAGYRWEVRSAPFPTQVTGPNVPPLHEVSVAVFWSESTTVKRYDLLTLRPQARPLPGGRQP
ncbi:general secretion pathway protein GspI [Xylophilus ampelinus]|uniref:General secretion pathway protein I n=1 Tax=Xylophilus ampelinus TaxID=54067 RepID=A0A318SF59_9BURK|nr:general secretion pathway protein GspI [Xylophilus ampelinus]MCS4510972.1 general secretion pathway protein GspI [Xylophilus ampelinus]PYE76035.1 general secretion pathway protein I [Xylophilus ampelinus]